MAFTPLAPRTATHIGAWVSGVRRVGQEACLIMPAPELRRRVMNPIPARPKARMARAYSV